MAKKKGNLSVVRSKQKLATRKETLDYLPTQDQDSVALYDTKVETLEDIIGADDFRFGLVKLKTKFKSEIQEWSRRFGVETDIRVYFTINQKQE